MHKFIDLFMLAVTPPRTAFATKSHHKTHNLDPLRVGRSRRSFLERSLALLLVILLAPSFSLAEIVPGPGTGARSSHAQIVIGPADQIIGIWVVPGGSKIEINKTGDKYYGTIIWMKTPRNDVHNKTVSLRSRPLVGAQVALSLTFSESAWYGELYEPETGATAEARITLKSQDNLEVRAMRGPSLLGHSVVWTRSK